MPNRPDERRLAAWRSLLEAHRAVVEILERELEHERNLPLSHYDVLLTLNEAPGRRMRMRDLAHSVLLSKSGLSRLVDRMVEAGLVCRERCDADRRGAFAVLTDPGRAALRSAAPVHLRGIQEHFARHLDDDEAATIRAALSRVTAAARSGTTTQGRQRERQQERQWAPATEGIEPEPAPLPEPLPAPALRGS